MDYPTLACRCGCGCPVSPTLMCLTPKKELLCVSHCPNCGKEVQTAFSIAKLYKACPKLELKVKQLTEAIDQAIEEATGKDKYELTEADLIRLHGMYIGEAV